MKNLLLVILMFICIDSYGQWEMSEKHNPMDNIIVYKKSIKSDNVEELKFPYDGGSIMYFELIGQKKDDLSVASIRLDKGQYIVKNGDVRFRLKLDDREPIKIIGMHIDSDNSILMIIDQPLLKSIKESNKILVGIELYGEGMKYFTFTIPQ